MSQFFRDLCWFWIGAGVERTLSVWWPGGNVWTPLIWVALCGALAYAFRLRSETMSR